MANLTLPNLWSLHVSRNLLSVVTFSHFSQLPNLRNLSLSWNPITHVLAGDDSHTHGGLQRLDLVGLQLIMPV